MRPFDSRPFLLIAAALTVVPACAPTGRVAIARDADRALPLLGSEPARAFARAAAHLPPVRPRTLHRDPATRETLDDAGYAALPPAARARFRTVRADEDYFYQGRYGTPLAYGRALDLLAAHGARLGPGVRLLDFGYGAIGQLRALALLGVAATGVDVDPGLPVLYRGQGGPLGDRGGSVRLIDGRWPADAAVATEVGGGYQIIIAKNTLKRGYIHPERPADPRQLIDLGVDDAGFLAATTAALAPGGLFLIYNICPRPSPPDRPFVPWSDGRSPFARADFARAGLAVIAFDVDDAAPMREMARAFGWDRGAEAMDLENDLSVLYTLAQRPPAG